MRTGTSTLHVASLSAAPADAGGNDDRILVDLARGLFVVADGMGGVRHGGRSAQMVVDAIPELVDRNPDDLAAVVEALQQRLTDLAARSVGGVGTTIVCAVVEPGAATVVHLGDSRALLARTGTVRHLTVDHSLAQTMIDTGELDPSQVATHPSRYRLTRYLGMSGAARPEMCRVGLRDGDRLLLCSDGLVGALTEEIIAETMCGPGDHEHTCRLLLEHAERRGLDDDTTALVIDVAGAALDPGEP